MSANGSGFYVTIATPKGSSVKRVEGDVLSVGRAEDCNLRIDNIEIGRRHLSFLLINGRCCVEDHASTNGTFLNGKRLEPHKAIPVTPKDQVQLGQSGIRLSVSTEVYAAPRTESGVHNGKEKEAVSKEESPQQRIVTTTSEQRRVTRLEAQTPVAQPRAPEVINEASERLLLEAQKKASLMVQNAEMEANKKVQEIYRVAEEVRAKSEQAYQRKLNQSFREAETVYQKAQSEAVEIMESARRNADELRNQAETFVAERRARTEADCERALEDAQNTARELKENRLLEADDLIRAKEEHLLKETRDNMTERRKVFEADLQREGERQRSQLDAELASRREAAEAEQKKLDTAVEHSRVEARQLAEESAREKNFLTDLEAKIEQQTEKMNQLTAEFEKIAQQRDQSKLTISEAQEEVSKLEIIQQSLQNQINETQKKMVIMHEEERGMSKRLASASESMASEVLKIKDSFEAEKVRLQKAEKEHEEQLKLDTARKLRELEAQMFNELVDKKERMGRELALAVETFIKENPTPDAKSLESLRGILMGQLDSQVVTMSKESSAKPGGKSLVALKRAERWKLRLTAAAIGAALMYGGQQAYVQVLSESAPMQRRVEAAAEERRLDLERRKFAPPQTPEIRDEYVDAVIYTKEFSTIYLSDNFQKKFLEALSPYMLKTWRVDEDKSIQVIAAADSLVKELVEKRENIHPDFVQKDVQKMHDLETPVTQRMGEILGSQVRYESFKKFERQFYEDYRSKQSLGN